MQESPYNITVIVFGEERHHIVTNWYIDGGVLFLEDESDPENVERWAYNTNAWHTFHMPRPGDEIEDRSEEDDEFVGDSLLDWSRDDA